MTTRHLVRFSMVLLAGLVATPSVAVESPRTGARIFRVEYLDVNEAALYARQVCLEHSGTECDYRIQGRGFVEISAEIDTLERIGRMLAERDVPPRTQVFQVTLLVASGEGTPDPAIPTFARAALDDVGSLLPFRGYRVLDTGIMRTSDEALLALGGDLGYEARLRFRGNAADRGLYVEAFRLVRSYVRWSAPPPTPESGGDASKSRATVTREVVSASFSMRVGETVVVGTSKLDGGEEALVVLLTALEE